MADMQVGVLSCSGEEYLGGTLARMAVRRVMEEMRPGKVVTLCLPLYIAGGEEERNFAKDYPVISVDGCGKYCAKNATLRFSGVVRDMINIADIVGEDTVLSEVVSMRDIKEEHHLMVNRIADEICRKVDVILAE